MNPLKKKIKDEMFDRLIYMVDCLRVVGQDVARLNGEVGIPQEVLIREVKKTIDRILDEWFI